MRKGYSVVKRGNNYYLYHRKNPEHKLVGVALKTNEQREAYRRAKEKVIELDAALAVSKLPNPYENLSEEESIQVATDLINGLSRSVGKYMDQQAREIQLQKQREEEEHRRILNERRQDFENPKLDAIWYLADNREDDTGIYVEWGNRNRTVNTMWRYRTAWKKFRTAMPHLQRLGDIDGQVSAQYEKMLIKEATQLKSQDLNHFVKGYMMCIKSIIATVIKQGWWNGTNNIVIRTQASNKRSKVVDFLKPEQIDTLLTAAKEMEDKTPYLFISIAVNTGMRKDEIANLRWEDFDFKNKLVSVQAKRADSEKGIQEFLPKSKQARSIPLKQELITILKPFKRESGYVISPEKNPKRSRWTPPDSFKWLQKKTGIKFHPHAFRHTFASWAANKGVSIYKIQKWLGHSSVDITAGLYAHLQAYDDDIDKF